MWGETIGWWIFSIIITLSTIFRVKYFMQHDKVYERQVNDLMSIKRHHIKSLDEQQRYVRGRSDMGQDFITMVGSIIIFFLGFYIIVYPLIPSLYTGILIVLVFAALFALIITKFFKSNKFFLQNFLDSFTNYLYSGFFILCIKFVHTIHPLLLLLSSIIIMIGIPIILNYFVNNKMIWRH